jgi:hypothetical protein
MSSTFPSVASVPEAQQAAAQAAATAAAAQDVLDLATALEAARNVAWLVGENGAKEEYLEFATSTQMHTHDNAFDFIRHACEGTGGFENGKYLDPHAREVPVLDNLTPTGLVLGGGGSRGALKYATRRKMADYDNFCRTIRDTHWGYIQQAKDLIKHDSDIPELQQFWRNADGRGTDIVDTLNVPWRESRMFGHSLIMVDRPQLPPNPTAADTSNPQTAAYCFSVPSQNVVWWEFNDTTKELELVAYLEPVASAPGSEMEDPQFAKPAPLKVWTDVLWASFVAVPKITDPNDNAGSRWKYALVEWETHPCDEVPSVLLYDDVPAPGQMFGATEMKQIALIAKSVYNLDSEAREIQRNCAFPILCIPTKDPSSIPSIVISTEGGLGFDGPGTPSYLTANLDSLVHIAASRLDKVQSCFGMAHLAAIIGTIKTSSGFHTLAEFDKSNRRLGRAAAQLEDAEMKLAWLVLKWHGWKEDVLDAGFAESDETHPSPYSISYPRDFGLRDDDVLVKRAKQLLDMNMGDEVNEAIFTDLLSSLYPRFPKTKVDSMVAGAVAALTAEREAANRLAPPAGAATPIASARVAAMLKASGIGKKAQKKAIPPQATVTGATSPAASEGPPPSGPSA